MSVWTASGPLVVRWFHGSRPLFTSAGVGTVLPLTQSSAGQVFAAHLPRHKVACCLQKAASELTYEDLAKTMKTVKARGFAWIDGLIVSGLRGVSVPVFDLQGEIQCALTLLSTDFALVDFPNEAQRQLVEAGQAASRQLGYSAA